MKRQEFKIHTDFIISKFCSKLMQVGSVLIIREIMRVYERSYLNRR